MAGLLDFLQGASNSAASNVSAPIDGINWLLRKAGLPVSEAPFLGSDWMAQKGLTREPQSRNAGLLGEAIGGVLPMVAAAKAPQIAKGLLQGAENMAAPRMLNRQAGVVNVEFPSVSDNLEKWALKQKHTDLAQFQKVGDSGEFSYFHKPVATPSRSSTDWDGFGDIVAMDRNGKVVGTTFYGPWGDIKGAPVLEGAVEVHPEFRRQGVASSMYDFIEKITGKKMEPASTNTPLAKAFWDSRSGQGN
jgi:hypothetical protein